MIIGITGGTGCGKTTLLSLIEEMGGTVLDCDRIYHLLLQTDPSLTQAIDARFPGTVEKGVLNRKKLGCIVFSDENALQDLNCITHHAVKKEVLRRLGETPGLAAIDAIGLFEGGLAPLCDVTVFVSAPVEDRIMRLMHRDGINEEYAAARIAAQHSDTWFQERCHHTLYNDRDLPAFQAKCIAFLDSLGIMKEKP